MVAPRELADRHGLGMQTPLLALSRALRARAVGNGWAKPGLSRTGPGVDQEIRAISVAATLAERAEFS